MKRRIFKIALVVLSAVIFASCVTFGVSAYGENNTLSENSNSEEKVYLNAANFDIEAEIEKYSLETVKSTDKASLSEYLIFVDGILSDENLSDTEREKVALLKAKINTLLDKIESVSKEIERIKSQLSLYDVSTVKTTDKESVDGLEFDVFELLSGDNLTPAERSEVLLLSENATNLHIAITTVLLGMEEVSGLLSLNTPTTLKTSDREVFEAALDTASVLLGCDNLLLEEREFLESGKETLEAYLSKIIKDTEDIRRMEEAIFSYYEYSVKMTDRDAINAIIIELNTLLSEPEITEEKQEKLNSFSEQAAILIEKLRSVNREYTAAISAFDSLNKNNPKYTDVQIINSITEAIWPLLTSDNLTEEERENLTYIQSESDHILGYILSENTELSSFLDAVYLYNVESVKSTDRKDLVSKRDTVISYLSSYGENERSILNLALDFINGLLGRISMVSVSLNSSVVNSYIERGLDKDNLLLSDRAVLNAALSELDGISFGYESNLTEEEKSFISEHITKIEELLMIVEKVSAVQNIINVLPSADTVKPFDTKAINALAPVLRKYGELSKSEIKMLDSSKMDSLIKAVYVYTIIEGGGAVKEIGDGKFLQFKPSTSNIAYSAVKVNGEVIEQGKYLRSNNNILILTNEYLGTLEAGEYTVSLVYQFGEATASFSIVEPVEDSGTLVAVVLCAVGVVLVATAFFMFKRKYSKQR